MKTGGRFYLGTYTRLDGPGIAVCRLEEDRLRVLSASFLENPTYVILNREGTTLYSVSGSPATGDTGGSVAAYRVEGDILRLLGRRNTVGMGPCHLCLSPDQRYLYTANYAGGSLSVFPVTEDGPGEIIQHIQHQGASAHPTRQTAAHAHQVTFIPGASLLCCADLGMDALLTYRQDPETGLLTLNDRYDTQPGFGPRHLVHGENGIAYLAHELANMVETLVREETGWRSLQVLPTLPDGWKGESTTAAVRIGGEDGRLVMVSNRGHDSIAVFDMGEDGRLTLKGIAPTGDDYPRDFNLVNGETLLIAHQNGGVRLSRLEDGCRLVCRDKLDVKGAVCVCI